MKGRASPSRAHAVADWLLGVTPGEPDAIRMGRLSSMFQKRPALAMSSLAILLVSTTTAATTGAPWARYWVMSDLLLIAARFMLSFRYDRAGVRPSMAAMRVIAFGSCGLLMLLGLGCSLAMATGIPMLMLISAISVMGLCIGVTSLWAGVPRLAFGMLAITAMPFATAIALGADMPFVAAQFLLLMLGTAAFVKQNNTKLLGMLHAEHRNRLLAETDQLTGLPNRGVLMDRLDAACAQDMPFALLYLDLDGFKAINDARGHAAGDVLLVEQADRIAATLAGGAMVCRLGGDEFVLVLDGADRITAGIVAQRLIALLSAPATSERVAGACVGVSIGISLSPADSTDPDALINLADRALYTAKDAGKGAYRFCDALGVDSRNAIPARKYGSALSAG